jgi:hypothetical protein
MTAHALVEERERCLQAGMNGHVTKPLDPDALFAAPAHWTKRREPAAPAPEKKPRCGWTYKFLHSEVSQIREWPKIVQ